MRSLSWAANGCSTGERILLTFLIWYGIILINQSKDNVRR